MCNFSNSSNRPVLKFVILFGLFFSSFALGFEVPSLTGPVVDQVGILSRREKHQLEELLQSHLKSGKIQTQILILKNLSGTSIEDASIRVVDRWKLGTETKDNGVLILLAIDEKKVRIEVGQGLEGDIPDVIASRVIREIMTPFFRSGRFAAGLEAGAHQLAAFAGVDSAQYNGMAQAEEDIPPWVKLILMLIAFLAFGLFSIASHHSGLRRGGFGMGGLGGHGSFGGGGRGWSGGGGGFSGGGASGGW